MLDVRVSCVLDLKRALLAPAEFKGKLSRNIVMVNEVAKIADVSRSITVACP
jgi:hypothetical protein